jgi:3-hydroxybutyrate dehydrogenase
MNLKDTLVVITGATGGLGTVAARAFGAQGARLALLSSDQAKLDALVQELALPPGQAQAHQVDLRDPGAVQGALQRMTQSQGTPHVLIHLVGGWVGASELVQTPTVNLEAMLNQHVWTTWHLLQAAVPHITESGWGRVIIVSSPVATYPKAQNAAYAAAKAAEEALILALAQEVPSGVTANILQVRTIDVGHQHEQAPGGKHADWTSPEEIVAAMLYLCSPAGGRVNGTRLPLFGRGW